jgi:hypothetical protein
MNAFRRYTVGDQFNENIDVWLLKKQLAAM